MNVRELQDDDPIFSQKPFSDWRSAVDRVLLRDWHINVVDAGIANWNLYECFQDGWSPDQYVSWFANKYDLIDFRDPQNQMEAVMNLLAIIQGKDPASK